MKLAIAVTFCALSCLAQIKLTDTASGSSACPSGKYGISITTSAGTMVLNCAAVTGTQGPAGATGATGATGPQGPSGPQGIAGPAGPQGVPGPTGPAGASGGSGTLGYGLISVSGATAVNTATILSVANAQAGSAIWCLATGSPNYTCTLSAVATLKAYKAGTALLVSGAGCTQACTLNVDGLGGVAIQQNNGTATAATFGAGIHIVAFDGVVWRLLL